MTTPDPIQAANAAQARASDPVASVFVSASAGSGKTKLLIDRLLQLMLPRRVVDPETGEARFIEGSAPGRIVCLTYTKAAAAEMAIRLQRTLGDWVTAPEARLDAALRVLAVEPNPTTRRAARELFVRVLDLPGGMRIGTIHAFCQSLLRRFPIEASISPHFALMEEADAYMALTGAVEAELARGDGARLAALSAQAGLDRFSSILGLLQSKAQDLQPVLAMNVSDRLDAYRHALGAPDETAEQIAARACTPPRESDLRTMLQAAVGRATASVAPRLRSMLMWLSENPSERQVIFREWEDGLLTGTGAPRAKGGLNGTLATAMPELVDALAEEAQRLLDIREAQSALALADLAVSLLEIVAPVLARFIATKEGTGQLDYNDLIARTLWLLNDAGAAWVLYKLDGGIDHILLDEVQDTSPEQWQIAGGLTSEFFAGSGARDDDLPTQVAPRTVFAVGDYKQSIYSFQGADPKSFHTWRQRFKHRVQGASATWREPSLVVSFRSTAPVLKLVDEVFANPESAKGLAEPGEATLSERHIPARVGEGGRVELWPPVAPDVDDASDDNPWAAPSGNAGRASPPQRLAEELAAWIAARIGQVPPFGGDVLQAGDVLVLVPRRSGFVKALIRALKARDVPVATLVRTELVDQVAVQDLMTLCDALLLPQDDLTLACVLTSPLGGLSDDGLMALSAARKGVPLWTVLRERHAERQDWTAAWTMIDTLFRRVDHATPYTLLSEALGANGGRARLLARLGPEAAEPVDELLSAALRYEATHPPSLQGFLHWLRNSNTMVRREPEGIGDAVRVMTAHGSKGLQARLVILPDTMGKPKSDSKLCWLDADGVEGRLPVWVPRAALASQATKMARDAIQNASREEHNRLLYVALTRASDWLVVCGWTGKNAAPAECWYEACRAGFAALGAEPAAQSEGWPENALVFQEQRTREKPVRPPNPRTTVPVSLPAWMGRAPDWRGVPPTQEPALFRPLAPSRPDMVAYGATPAVLSPLARGQTVRTGDGREAAMRRGSLLHSLLQVLPDVAVPERHARAVAWLSRRAHGMTETDVARLATQISDVLAHPDLAPLFGPTGRAEQQIAGVAGGRVIVGQVDRMVVAPDGVWVCDYKTNRAPPVDAARTPVVYVRQMAAYRALLENLYPGRPIHCTLVWTETGAVTVLPESLLAQHAPGLDPAAQMIMSETS